MRQYITLLILMLSLNVLAQDVMMIPFESTWKYLDKGTNQGTVWRANNFDDSSWASGRGILGYGESNLNTIVSFGNDSDDKHITTYFRHTFSIADVSLFHNFLLRLQKDDAAIVYVNGQEVMRSNFGQGTIGYLKEASTTISSEEEDIIWEELISPGFFQTGDNVIAVEVHQRDGESSDLIFDLSLLGLDQAPSLYREPYLQKASPEGMTIKWKTDVPTDSKVWYGSDVNSLTTIVESAELTTNHEIDISGLEADTDYFYKIGNAEREFAGGAAEYFFKTSPAFGSAKSTRIWVTGDAGTGKDEQMDVRNAYLNFAGANGKADLWLMLGDNAYEHGREADYHMGLFTVYQEVLRNTVSYPAAGNHDLLGEASAITETGTFYDIFALPKNGESGGLPSNKESYYSVDYGNIHIVCLESYDLDRRTSGAMATWLKEDLQNTDAEWLIAYWHFPPYSKVSHDTDDPDDFNGRSTDMRKNFNPILEQYGVDLVLSGHSHGYERSYLIDGHYGVSSTLTTSMVLDGTSGNMNTTGAYRKPDKLSSHKGTVYAVCGSSGKLSSPLDDGPHAAMYETNTDFAGSMVIDIVGNTLEGKFLNEQGIIQDYFHIVKENSTSTQDLKVSSRIDLYPNPAQNHFAVRFSEDFQLQDGSLEIYRADGKLVKSLELENLSLNTADLSVNIADLTPGIYTVKLLEDRKHLESKLLMVH